MSTSSNSTKESRWNKKKTMSEFCSKQMARRGSNDSALATFSVFLNCSASCLSALHCRDLPRSIQTLLIYLVSWTQYLLGPANNQTCTFHHVCHHNTSFHRATSSMARVIQHWHAARFLAGRPENSGMKNKAQTHWIQFVPCALVLCVSLNVHFHYSHVSFTTPTSLSLLPHLFHYSHITLSYSFSLPALHASRTHTDTLLTVNHTRYMLELRVWGTGGGKQRTCSTGRLSESLIRKYLFNTAKIWLLRIWNLRMRSTIFFSGWTEQHKIITSFKHTHMLTSTWLQMNTFQMNVV